MTAPDCSHAASDWHLQSPLEMSLFGCTRCSQMVAWTLLSRVNCQTAKALCWSGVDEWIEMCRYLPQELHGRSTRFRSSDFQLESMYSIPLHSFPCWAISILATVLSSVLQRLSVSWSVPRATLVDPHKYSCYWMPLRNLKWSRWPTWVQVFKHSGFHLYL